MDRLLLQVKVVKCIALKRLNVSPIKKADPYVIVQVEDTVASTGVKEMTLEPIYNETFAFDVTHNFLEKERGMITVKVCHRQGGQGKLMGEVTITFAKIVEGTNYLPIHAPKSKTLVGQVVLSVTKTSLMNQYIRLKSDALSYTKGSGGKYSGGKYEKPMLSYQKAALEKVPTPSRPINSTPTKQGTTPYNGSPSKGTPVSTKKPPSKYTTNPSPGKKVPQRVAPPRKGEKKGGPLALLKIPLALAAVAAGGLLGISFVSEETLDNDLTRFAKKARKETRVKAEVWGKAAAKNAHKYSKEGAHHAGVAANFAKDKTGSAANFAKEKTGIAKDKAGTWFSRLCGKTHIVQYGDSLSKLAKKYNTSVDKLLAKNGVVNDENLILVGNSIRV